MEKTKRDIFGYEALIAEFEELKSEKKPNRNRIKELKEKLTSEKEYYAKEITTEKIENTRNKIQNSVSMDEKTKAKNLEKLAYLEAQKELYAKNEEIINSCLSYRVLLSRKLNNTGKGNKKIIGAILTGVVCIGLLAGLSRCSYNKGYENGTNIEQTEDDSNGKDTKPENPDSKDDNKTEDDSLSAKDDKEEKDKSNKNKSEEDNKNDSKDTDKSKDDTTSTNQKGTKPTGSTTVTPNDGNTENANTGKETTTTTSKTVTPEVVPTTGKLPVEPSTETDDSDKPTITPGKTETEDDGNNNPDTDNVDESKTKKDDEETHFTPEEKKYEPEGTRTDYQDEEYDDEGSKKQDTTGYTVDGDDKTVYPTPTPKPSEPEGTPRQTPEDVTEEETSPTYIPPVTDDYIIESSVPNYYNSSSSTEWTAINNKEENETNTTVEKPSEPTIITYDETTGNWINLNKDTVIEENNGTDYDTSDFTFPEDDEDEVIEINSNGKTLTYTLN